MPKHLQASWKVQVEMNLSPPHLLATDILVAGGNLERAMGKDIPRDLLNLDGQNVGSQHSRVVTSASFGMRRPGVARIGFPLGVVAGNPVPWGLPPFARHRKPDVLGVTCGNSGPTPCIHAAFPGQSPKWLVTDTFSETPICSRRSSQQAPLQPVDLLKSTPREPKRCANQKKEKSKDTQMVLQKRRGGQE